MEILGLTRIPGQSSRWSQILLRYREPLRLALQNDGDHIDGTLQIEDASTQDEVIQMRIARTPVVKRLEIAGMLLVFPKDTCSSRRLIEAFAAHHIGDTCLKRCNDADVKHILPLRQVSLGATTNDHHLPRGNCSLNDMAACFMEGARIHTERNIHRYRHGRMKQSQALENTRGQTLNTLIVLFCFPLANT